MSRQPVKLPVGPRERPCARCQARPRLDYAPYCLECRRDVQRERKER